MSYVIQRKRWSNNVGGISGQLPVYMVSTDGDGLEPDDPKQHKWTPRKGITIIIYFIVIVLHFPSNEGVASSLKLGSNMEHHWTFWV